MPSKELIAASTVSLVLSLLAEGDSYGYALIKRVRELSEDRIEWTEGMLYPVLRWMEEKGQIASEWRDIDGRNRKYYRILAQGRATLQREREDWLVVHRTLSKAWKKNTSSR